MHNPANYPLVFWLGSQNLALLDMVNSFQIKMQIKLFLIKLFLNAC